MISFSVKSDGVAGAKENMRYIAVYIYIRKVASLIFQRVIIRRRREIDRLAILRATLRKYRVA